MLKKQSAFSLAEIIVVLMILGVIITITVSSTLNSPEIRRKKINALSKGFYQEAEYAYLNIITNETKGMNITNLDSESYDDEDDTIKLEKLFEEYMDMEEIPCSDLPDNVLINDDRIDGKLKCAYSKRGANAGFYLNRECKGTYLTKPYLQDNLDLKEVTNACGYIAYAPKNSKGESGVDFFLFALGKRGVK